MRAWIYDRAILKLTSQWYAHMLERLDPGSALLDVGIGPGGALCANAATVIGNDITVTGVDIDATYLDTARERVAEAGMADRVTILHQSIYDHADGPYDAVYFGASFMLMPDPVACLRHVTTLLKPGGKLIFTQTFHDRKAPMMEKVKPLLHKVTTIHFGRVTYEEEFRETLEAGDVDLKELTVIGTSGRTSYRIAVATPRI